MLDYCPSIYNGTGNEVSFLKTLKCSPKDSTNSQLAEFILYCDPFFQVASYAKRAAESTLCMGRFSVIKYRFSTLNSIGLAQVIGIVKTNGCIQLLVSRLIEEEIKSTFRKLPYPLYKYATQPHDRTRFSFDYVRIPDIIAPCFYIPAVDHSNMNLTDVGIHHWTKEHTSYFYVLTQNRSQLIDQLEYKDYLSYNQFPHPWDNAVGSTKCYNFNFYLCDEEKILVRDIINA